MNQTLTREQLFLMVWERPSPQVAKELGISDVALGKWCKKLQVPKPPPGYWAKIQAGKHPRKPLLKEFSEQLEKRQKKAVQRRKRAEGWITLTAVQLEIFRRATEELAQAGVNLDSLKISATEIRFKDGDLAAKVILLIQQQYLKWLKKRTNTGQVASASIRSVQALTSKLLPLAKAHTLVLEREPEKYRRDERGPVFVIRLIPEFRQQVANLYHVVLENNLAYAVWDLRIFEAAWTVQYHYHFDDFASTRSQLCVSRQSVWVMSTVNRFGWSGEWSESLVTKKIPIEHVSPVELLQKSPIDLPSILDMTKTSVSKERIQAFVDADNAFDIISSAMWRYDNMVPNDHLAILDRLIGDKNQILSQARDRWDTLLVDLERWENILDAERESICGQALGISIGDTVLAETRNGSVRLRVDQMHMIITDDNKLMFTLSGARYRKDGLPGKRTDAVHIYSNAVVV